MEMPSHNVTCNFGTQGVPTTFAVQRRVHSATRLAKAKFSVHTPRLRTLVSEGLTKLYTE